MKKYLLITLLVISMFALAACGSGTTSVGEDEKRSKDEVKIKENQPATESEKVEKKKDEIVQEDIDFKATDTFTNKELGITGTTGPMNYEISAVQLTKIVPKNQATADLFEVSVGDTVHAISIDMSGENTSDEDISFYLGLATIITNTKEQLEPSMLTKLIEGNYLGQVKHKGQNAYILKNSTVDDLKTIEIRIHAPANRNYESLGEDVKQVIEVNN